MPRSGLWTLDIPSSLKHASSVYTVQVVVAIDIYQFPSVVDDRLESGVRSLSSGIDRHGVLRGSSSGTVPVLVSYRVRFSIPPYLQLCHLSGLVFIQSVSDLHSMCRTSCLTEAPLQ